MEPRHDDATDLPALPRGDPDKTARIASTFTIQDRVTSARTVWTPNDEQCSLWVLLALYAWLFVVKPRKIGTSTAGEFDLGLWTNAADAAGNRVRSVFAIDTDAKALEHCERVADFMHQKRVRCSVRRSSPYSVRFPSGSKLDFLTLGGDEPGRGGDIHRLQVTELPYAAHPERAYHALRSACADNARGLVETTMTSADPFTIDLWRGFRRDAASRKQVPIGTEFYRHFFKVTEQRSYRCRMLEVDDTRSVHAVRGKSGWETREFTASEWAYCKTQGFPDTVDGREAAAWWWLDALPNKAHGDLLTLMHDYPQIEAHLFVATVGRAITVTPEVAVVVDTRDLHGKRGERWTLEIAIPPEQTSGSHFVVVDTAFAKGKSNSVVLVVDIADGRICAWFCSSQVWTDDLASMAQLARELYLRGPGKKRRADVIIENDGVGDETCKDATTIGLPFTVFSQQSTSQKYGGGECVKAAKSMIEAVDVAGKSMVRGPLELVDECEKLRKTEDGFEGYKDVIMCLGMAAIRRRESGVREADAEWKKQRHSLKRVFPEDRMREERRKYAYLDNWGRRI